MYEENNSQQQKSNEGNSQQQYRQMASPEEDNINLSHKMCAQHKRKIEFVCLTDQCFAIRFMCSKCQSLHDKHPKSIITLDDYISIQLEKEQDLYRQRQQMVSERVIQMKRIMKKINSSIQKMEKDEMEEIERQFDEVNLRRQEKQQPSLEYYNDPQNQPSTQIQQQLVNKENGYIQIQQVGQNIYGLVERKQYDISNLQGVIISQDNLFEIEKRQLKKQNLKNGIMRGNAMSDNQSIDSEAEEEGQHFTSFVTDLENGKIIVTFLKLTQEIIIFSNNKNIYYYNIVTKKILHRVRLEGNVFIMKLEKINEKKVALLLYLEFRDQELPGVIIFDFEVYILEERQNSIQKKRVYIPDQVSVYRDIKSVQNSSLLVIILEDAKLVIINTNNSKMISKYDGEIDQQQFPFEGIQFCTLLYNFTLDNQFYKQIVVIHLINGSFGYWDFVANKFFLKSQQPNLITKMYASCVPVKISSAFSNQIQLRKPMISKQQYILLVQGKPNEVFFYRDYDGQVEIKTNFQVIQYFDLFYNKSAIPFYYKNTIFFYDFIENKRLKTINITSQCPRLSQQVKNHFEIIINYPNLQYQIQIDRSLFHQPNNNRYSAFQANNQRNNQGQAQSSQISRRSSNQSQFGNFNNNQSQQSSQNQQNQSQQQLSFSQIWDQQLEQIQQNQRNIQPMQFQQNNRSNINLDRQNNIRSFNNQIFQNEHNHNQSQSTNSNSSQNVSNIQSNHPHDIQNDNQSNKNQNNNNNNNQRDIFNNKLIDMCPTAIINHFEFIVVIFPNGVIQYLK